MRVYLKEWREHPRFGLTLEQVADRIGTTKGTVQRMEANTREPNLGYLAAFAEALDIEVAEIFRHPDRPSRDELLRQQAADQIREAISIIDRRTGTNN